MVCIGFTTRGCFLNETMRLAKNNILISSSKSHSGKWHLCEPFEVELSNIFVVHQKTKLEEREKHRYAYAVIMYMGTMRDYEFYVAMHVMIRSLVNETKLYDSSESLTNDANYSLDVPSFSPLFQNLSYMKTLEF